MTNERKKQLLIGVAVGVVAILAFMFLRGRPPVGADDPTGTAMIDGTITPGLVTPPTGGTMTTYNIPPYVPPNAPQMTYNIGGGTPLPVAAPPCPCPKVCEGAPTYFASENVFMNSPPAPILQWYQNTVPPPPPEPEPVFLMGRNQLAASIANARATIQSLFGYGIG